MNIWLTQSLLSSKVLSNNLPDLPIILCPVLSLVHLSLPKINLTSDTWVFLTSKTAINIWVKQYPIPNNVVVMGQSSAIWASELGIDNPLYFGEGSESLLDALSLPINSHVIVASAERRRGVLEDELVNRGHIVDSLVLYKNKPCINKLSFLKNNLQPRDMIIIASEHAAELVIPLAYDLSINWITISHRLKKIIQDNINCGKIICTESSLKLSGAISKCYLDNK